MTIFRSGFYFLILVNLLLFTWAQGYWGKSEEGHEPQRLGRQLNADKLRITPSEVSPAVAAMGTSLSPSLATASRMADPPLLPSSELGPKAVETACRLVDGLLLPAAEALKQSFESLGWQVKLTSRAEPTYLILIPELANKAAAEKKVGELERRGVIELKVLSFENQRHEIQLGNFKDEASARLFLASLAKKGVTSARQELRTATAPSAQLETKGPRTELETKLPALLAAYAGISNVACGENAP